MRLKFDAEIVFTETATLMSELDAEPLGPPTFLPWGALRERHYFPEVIHISPNAKPGEFVLQTLFAEFCTMAEKKINTVLDVPVRLLWLFVLIVTIVMPFKFLL